MNIPASTLPRVVIAGGGFGGLQLARRLTGKKFQVVLIDRNNYHVFQPLLYQVATAGLEPGSIAYPFRKILHGRRNFFFRLATLREINHMEKKLITDIGELQYDYLVLAMGAKTNYFGIQSIEQNAVPMKTLTEALDIRSLFLQNLEKALLTRNLDERRTLMSIVIIGGGPTGVELAGALAELKRDILPADYPDLDIREMKIHLVESNAELLKEMHDKSSARALQTLRKMDVDVWLGERVAGYDGREITCQSGRKLSGAAVIWAAGVSGQVPKGIPESSIAGGRLLVNEFSAVMGLNDVFALGDMARMSEGKYTEGHPMLAQPAIQQGRLLARNLERLINGEPLIPFKYRNKGVMATIGRNKALCELPFLRFYGWAAWVAWLALHITQLIGFRNKLVVLVNWAQNYLRHARDLRLIIRPFVRK